MPHCGRSLRSLHDIIHINENKMAAAGKYSHTAVFLDVIIPETVYSADELTDVLFCSYIIIIHITSVYHKRIIQIFK